MVASQQRCEPFNKLSKFTVYSIMKAKKGEEFDQKLEIYIGIRYPPKILQRYLLLIPCLECSFWLSCSVFSLIVWANLDYFYTVFRLLVRVTLCIVFRTFIWNFRGFKFRLDCFFLELFGFQVWSTRQPPQTPPKRREWILHRKRRKRNFEHFVLSNMNLPTISIVTGSIFWGLRVGFLGIWGGMQLPVDRRGQSSWLFLLAVVSWTFLSLTCTVLGLLKYPWRLRNFLKYPPKS